MLPWPPANRPQPRVLGNGSCRAQPCVQPPPERSRCSLLRRSLADVDADEPYFSSKPFVSGEISPFSVLRFRFFRRRVVWPCSCVRASPRATLLPDVCVLAPPPHSPRPPCSVSPRAPASSSWASPMAPADARRGAALRPLAPARAAPSPG